MICIPCSGDDHRECLNLPTLYANWCDCQHEPHGTAQVIRPEGIPTGEVVHGGESPGQGQED